MSVALRDPVTHGADPADQRRLVAIGALIDDLSPEAIATHAKGSPLTARAAVEEAEEAGVIRDGRIVDSRWAAAIVAELDERTRAEVLEVLSRRLLNTSGDSLAVVVGHCRAAAATVGAEAIAGAAEAAGRAALASRSYSRAAATLQLAVDLDHGATAVRVERLLSLASALDGTGDIHSAREVLADAALLAASLGETHLTARAAVDYALPSDWFAGDHRAIELLRMADEMGLDDPDRAMVMAARGLVEMRIPVVHDDDNQYAWVTRPDAAQPLAEAALEMADPEWPVSRAVVLLAWRATHRSPESLARRREVTTELVDLAHRINDPWLLVMGAEWAAVDAIESGDRATYDKMVAVARWAAEHDGNPRVRWRAAALATGGAYLDGDQSRAHDLIALGSAALAGTSSPCWVGAEILFLGEEVVLRDDPAEMATHLDHESAPAQLNPLAQASFTYLCARVGEPERGRPHFERSWRAIDSESSMLLHLSRLSAAAVELGMRDRIAQLIDLLSPYREHVVVDAHGWWVDGPVAGWLAHLHAALGNTDVATELARYALGRAEAINDVRAVARLEDLLRRLDAGSGPTVADSTTATESVGLSDRETRVLHLLAAGMTNAEIAAELAYSVSTIRNATVAIYRRLGVKGRADAVAKAHHLGLLG